MERGSTLTDYIYITHKRNLDSPMLCSLWWISNASPLFLLDFRIKNIHVDDRWTRNANFPSDSLPVIVGQLLMSISCFVRNAFVSSLKINKREETHSAQPSHCTAMVSIPKLNLKYFGELVLIMPMRCEIIHIPNSICSIIRKKYFLMWYTGNGFVLRKPDTRPLLWLT